MGKRVEMPFVLAGILFQINALFRVKMIFSDRTNENLITTNYCLQVYTGNSVETFFALLYKFNVVLIDG